MSKSLRRLTITFDPDTHYFIVLIAKSDCGEDTTPFLPTLFKGAQLHPGELKAFFYEVKDALRSFFNVFKVKIRLVIEKPLNYGKNPRLVKDLEKKIEELIKCVKHTVFKEEEITVYFLTPQQYKGGVPKEIFHNRILVGTYKQQFEQMYIEKYDSQPNSPCRADLADCYGLLLFNQGITTTGGIFNAITW